MTVKCCHAADSQPTIPPPPVHVPAARVHIGENSDHVVPQRERLEGGGDDDVAALWQRAPHEDRPSVDVGGRVHTLLGQDVVHPILPVHFHLEKKRKTS